MRANAAPRPLRSCKAPLHLAVLLAALVLAAFSSPRVFAAELLVNGDFAQGLASWRVNPALGAWSPLQSGALDCEPSEDFRGVIAWQPLNVSGVGGKTLRFSAGVKSVSSSAGAAVVITLDFIDQNGDRRRETALTVSNSQAGDGAFATVTRSYRAPNEAVRLVRLMVSRLDAGHFQVDNLSLSADGLSPGALPVVTGLSSASGAYRSSVTVTGSGFGATRGAARLSFVENADLPANSFYSSWQDNVTVDSWSDAQLVFTTYEPNASGAFILTRADGVEALGSYSYEITSTHFTIELSKQRADIPQGGKDALSITLNISPQGATYPGGIGILTSGCGDETAFTVTPETLTASGVYTLNIDAAGLPPGPCDVEIQTLENASYARFAPLQVNVASRAGGVRANPYAAKGASGAPAMTMGLPRHRINLVTLDAMLEGSLFRMKTNGPPLRMDLWFVRYPGARTGIFGQGWRMSYESDIVQTGQTALVTTTDGKELAFTTYSDLSQATEASPVTLTPPADNYDVLICYGTYFIYTEKRTKLRYRYEKPAATDTTSLLAAITDKNDRSLTITADQANGRVLSVADPAGRTFTLGYDGSGHCVSVTAPDGRAYAFSYTQNNLTRITDPAGYAAAYAYDADGFMTSMDTAGRQITFTLAARPNGRTGDKYVSLVNLPEGGQMSYAFTDASCETVSATDGRGARRLYRNAGGQTAMTIDPTGELRQMTFENQLPVTLVDGAGNTDGMQYDARGNLTLLTGPMGNETTLTYDANDNVLTRTDALDRTWTYAYDADGNLIKVTDPLSGLTTLTRDPDGNLTSVRDPMGRTTSFVYDANGNVIRSTDPLSKQTAFEYDAKGMRLTAIEDARGARKELTYDALDRLIRIDWRNAGGTLEASVVNAFNAFGQISRQDELGDVTTAERNALFQLKTLTDPLGAETAYSYDVAGNLVSAVNALGGATRSQYDESGRLTQTLDPMDHAVTRVYNAADKVSRINDPLGHSLSFEYDGDGDLVKTTDALGNMVTTARDALGRPARIVNARGQTVVLTYDALGRKTRKTYQDAGIQYDYVYDADGNMTSMTGPDGTTTYAYTARNELLSIAYPGGAAITFAYDDVGNQNSVTYPDGVTATTVYDGFNRTVLPASLRNAASTELFPFAEKPNQPVSVSFAGQSATITLDAAARPTRYDRSNATRTDIAYDANGRRTRITHAKSGVAFYDSVLGYDALGRLTSQTFPDSVPDQGNATFAVNEANQITTSNAESFVYDADGNLTSAGSRFSAAYDAENHLTSLTRNGQTATYVYNGLGQRASKTLDGLTLRYLYDPAGRLLCVTDGSGTVKADYVYAGGRILAQGSAVKGWSFTHQDVSGNVAALTDASGAAYASYRYLPYGAIEVYGTPGDNVLTYSGLFGVLDESDGLYAMGLRFYDAALGRFLHKDPLGIRGGLNLYAYAAGAPLLRTDPKGTLILETAAILITGAWALSRLYNAYGTAKHGVDAAKKTRDAVNAAGRANRHFNNARDNARNLQRISSNPGDTLEEEIARQDALKRSRQNTYNSGVETKDDLMETAGDSAEAVYHGARFIQGVAGAKAPVPETSGDKVLEMVNDAAWNEVDSEVLPPDNE